MTRYALVIGIQTYDGPGFRNLEKPAEDAEAIAQILEAHGDFTVKRLPSRWNAEKNGYEISHDPLKGAELDKAITDFFKQVGTNEALIYFSGHGQQVAKMGREKGYLVTSDCTNETLEKNGIALDDLNSLIAQANCTSLVVLLDCCHSGSLLEKSQISSALNIFTKGDRNYFLATACRSHEKAYEDKEHGLFTAAVLKALRTPDKNGHVRTARLNQVIDEELTASGQQPVILKSGGEITLVYSSAVEKIKTGNIPDISHIRGLTSLETKISDTSFRNYLTDEALPYYSRSAHLSIDPAPVNSAIADEIELLQRLNRNELTGLIITGSGGIGKTRLMLEIGRRAAAESWVVLRVRERVKTDAIYQLADMIDHSQSVLLLVDYLETQQDFSELVETLNELNEDEGYRFRYLANCRTTYYSSIRDVYKHQRVNLSPPDEALDWFKRYRCETVRHILRQSGVGITDEYLDLCKETPILAVFLAYLQSCGRGDELAALAKEDSFGQWLLRRIRLSFQKPPIERDLALLIAQFPLNETAVENIYRGPHQQLFERLASDGWIEKDSFDLDLSGEKNWVTSHDVLADQVLTQYLESIPNTVEMFISELLEFAVKDGCLRSTFYTLQRLIDIPELSHIDWFKILSQQMRRNPSSWKEIRDVLLRTSLLPPLRRISLLDSHTTIWEGIETELDFQNCLAWLTRQYLYMSNNDRDPALITTLSSWIQKAVPQISRVNLLLKWGLKLCPNVVQEAALKWTVEYPGKFQTHYLLVAWLECGLPTKEVSTAVQRWLYSNSSTLEASFG